MNKGVLIWGYFSSFILLLGAIFMNLNFVAGKVLYLVGFFAFNFGYLIPLFFVIFQQNQENKIGVVLILGVLGFLCFLTGVSFFVVNWGGGIVLIYTGGGMLILAILTIIFMSRRFYETHIDSWFPVLVFGVFIVVSLLTGMVHRKVMRVFSVNNKDLTELVKSLKDNNERTYFKLNKNDSLLIYNGVYGINQLQTLQNKVSAFYLYVEDLKFVLLGKVKEDKLPFFKDMGMENLVPVQSNVEINAVNKIMIKHKNGEAYRLKKELEHLRSLIKSIVPKDEYFLMKYIESSLNTESYDLGRRRYNKSWEYQNFYDFPIITVLNQLTNIQYKVFAVEREVLHYFERISGSEVESSRIQEGYPSILIAQ